MGNVGVNIMVTKLLNIISVGIVIEPLKKKCLKDFLEILFKRTEFTGYNCAVKHWNEEHPKHKIARAAWFMLEEAL